MKAFNCNYQIYAALHEDIAEGFVWLKKDGLPSRSVVKIVRLNHGRRRSIFCEALQFDPNFMRKYNQQPRAMIYQPEISIVMNHWYRAKLGLPGTPSETDQGYTLKILAPSRWNRWWWSMHACRQHPQLALRVAFYLGCLGAALGVLPLIPNLFRILTPLLGKAWPYIPHLAITKWISIALALLAGMSGLIAAGYWLRASKVPIHPTWNTEPGEADAAEAGWITGMLQTSVISANMNATAARWTAVSVFLAAAASVVGTSP